MCCIPDTRHQRIAERQLYVSFVACRTLYLSCLSENSEYVCHAWPSDRYSIPHIYCSLYFSILLRKIIIIHVWINVVYCCWLLCLCRRGGRCGSFRLWRFVFRPHCCSFKSGVVSLPKHSWSATSFGWWRTTVDGMISSRNRACIVRGLICLKVYLPPCGRMPCCRLGIWFPVVWFIRTIIDLLVFGMLENTTLNLYMMNIKISKYTSNVLLLFNYDLNAYAWNFFITMETMVHIVLLLVLNQVRKIPVTGMRLCTLC